MTIESLATRLAAKATVYADTTADWVRFLKDHRELILSKSTLTAIDYDTMAVYRYRPEEYLDFMGVPRGLAWLVLWLNQIHTAHDFVGLSALYLPDYRHIDELHRLYRTEQTQLNR